MNREEMNLICRNICNIGHLHWEAAELEQHDAEQRAEIERVIQWSNFEVGMRDEKIEEQAKRIQVLEEVVAKVGDAKNLAKQAGEFFASLPGYKEPPCTPS